MFLHTYNNPATGLKDIRTKAQWIVICYNEHTEPGLYIRLNNRHWGKVYPSDVNNVVAKLEKYNIRFMMDRVRNYKHGYMAYDTGSLPENIAEIILDCNNKVYYS